MSDTHSFFDDLRSWTLPRRQEGIPQRILANFAFIGGFYFRTDLCQQDRWEKQHPRFPVLCFEHQRPTSSQIDEVWDARRS